MDATVTSRAAAIFMAVDKVGIPPLISSRAIVAVDTSARLARASMDKPASSRSLRKFETEGLGDAIGSAMGRIRAHLLPRRKLLPLAFSA
jgi:hypothetical protein